MQKIIGLDIGSYSIKAVEIINTFKSYEIANFYENVIPHIEELSPDMVVPTCMEQLFDQNNIRADRIVTAMPGQYISSRVIPFAFNNPRKIESSIIPTVEDVVPFNLDDMIVDHQILGAHEDQTVALVVMTRKNFLASFLEHLQRINIDPKLVDVDSLAFYNLSPYLKMEPGKCYGLVDVGHEKTSVCIVQDHILRTFRSINLGGRYLTEFLARDLEVDFNEAQRIKHRVSQVFCEADKGHDLQGDDKIIAERMTLAANAIVKELGRTLYAFKTWEKSPIEGIFLSGGTATVKNFDSYLSDHLEVAVSNNRLDQTDLKISDDLSDDMPKMTQGIAIGIRAITSMKHHSQINLRRGEFAYVQDYESVLKGAGMAFKVVAVALLLLSMTYAFKFFFYNQQISSVQEEYRKEFLRQFKDDKALARKYRKGKAIKFKAMRNDATSRLRAGLEAKKFALEDFLKENSSSASLIALSDISAAIPKDVEIAITEYNFVLTAEGNGRIDMKGQTDSYQSVALVIDALKTIPKLQGVEERESGLVPGSKTNEVSFKVNANYILGEDDASS